MEILRRVRVPTGDILVVDGETGYLELISVGDYGKDVNLKCDSMGLTRVPDKVRHTDMLPLEEKWVITISTQYGCSMGCKFCDVPLVGPGKNATTKDMIEQIEAGISLHPKVKTTERLNIHFARMGEPTWNRNVIEAAMMLKEMEENPPTSWTLRKCKIHPVVSTMMPSQNKDVLPFLREWMHVKNVTYEGNAGLQLSINSTDEQERFGMFNNNSCRMIDDIGHIMRVVPAPVGRKITLNFAVANYTVDPDELLRFFSPDRYIIKLTPMHNTTTATKNNIQTDGDYTEYYPYKELEEKLKAAGYDVIVFIASKEEDESRITCGNAILTDKIGMAVTCRECGMIKQPIGRSAPMGTAGLYCTTDCGGYWNDPKPSQLWPGETQEEFGY